ncbi:tRNA threonylcarbamoyladenosine dehydratase [compost metagenome]
MFSTEQLSYPDGQGGTCQAKAASDGNMKMDCASGFGAVTPVTATFGLVAASRVLKKIAERGARVERAALMDSREDISQPPVAGDQAEA